MNVFQCHIKDTVEPEDESAKQGEPEDESARPYFLQSGRAKVKIRFVFRYPWGRAAAAAAASSR